MWRKGDRVGERLVRGYHIEWETDRPLHKQRTFPSETAQVLDPLNLRKDIQTGPEGKTGGLGWSGSLEQGCGIVDPLVPRERDRGATLDPELGGDLRAEWPGNPEPRCLPRAGCDPGRLPRGIRGLGGQRPAGGRGGPASWARAAAPSSRGDRTGAEGGALSAGLRPRYRRPAGAPRGPPRPGGEAPAPLRLASSARLRRRARRALHL